MPGRWSLGRGRGGRVIAGRTFDFALALVLWLGIQGFLAWMQMTEFSNVSGLAHLGGASVGLLAYCGERTLRRSRLSELDPEGSL